LSGLGRGARLLPGPGAVLARRLPPQAAEGPAEGVAEPAGGQVHAPAGQVGARALDGLEAGHLEIIADRDTALAKAALGADPALVYAGLLG
jgi:hypothetical protein